MYPNIPCWSRLSRTWFHARLKLAINDASSSFSVSVNTHTETRKCNINLPTELLTLLTGRDLSKKISYFDVLCFSSVNSSVKFVHEKAL